MIQPIKSIEMLEHIYLTPQRIPIVDPGTINTSHLIHIRDSTLSNQSHLKFVPTIVGIAGILSSYIIVRATIEEPIRVTIEQNSTSFGTFAHFKASSVALDNDSIVSYFILDTGLYPFVNIGSMDSKDSIFLYPIFWNKTFEKLSLVRLRVPGLKEIDSRLKDIEIIDGISYKYLVSGQMDIPF